MGTSMVACYVPASCLLARGGTEHPHRWGHAALELEDTTDAP